MRTFFRAARGAAGGAAAAGMLAVCLAGCTVATPSSSAASASGPALSVAAAAPGAALVVTVPDLASASSVGSSVAPSAVRRVPSTGSTASSVPTSRATSSVSTAPVTVTSALTSAAPSTLKVTLANCTGCTVLATHAGVTSSLGAALVSTGQGHAALLSLRSDGSVAGAANVLYGASFPTPPGGQLGCDSAGRCIVIAQQANGTAIASAYQVSAAGEWADVTGRPGITSVTAKATTLAVGGGVGVAVQDQADGSTVWIVYAWAGDGYAVKGCTAAATPDVSALSMTACLS